MNTVPQTSFELKSNVLFRQVTEGRLAAKKELKSELEAKGFKVRRGVPGFGALMVEDGNQEKHYLFSLTEIQELIFEKVVAS